MKKNKGKIAVAMSGGVDSSVVAKILKDEGHDLVGLFLKMWSDPKCSTKKENRCCDYEALEDARAVAKSLEIPFYVINAEQEFKKMVVDYFLDEYKNLRTPNPCIVCNKKIKFDLLLRKALEIDCDKLATGHYAKVTCNNKGCQLFKGEDYEKDQSYMLYSLNQDQLGKILFPIGGMKKRDVRALAIKWDLPVKEKPESQEICFFGDKDYRAFLKRYLPEKYFKSGDIVDTSGKNLGEHEGLINYTIGQRKGIDQKIFSGGDKNPLYVVGYDPKKNQLIVGHDEDVYKQEMIVGDLHWIDPKSNSSKLKAKSLSVKIRYQHPSVTCRIASHPELIEGSGKLKVKFKKPQRAITPGQSAVFYLGDEVVGGGVIKS
ncbi:MAG TPA: tRNA 2-thiouridine(34) synthase MnmA [bacterium]|nr:tRNA 2-thiouridine(34) synthase MnmA [bacterium]